MSRAIFATSSFQKVCPTFPNVAHSFCGVDIVVVVARGRVFIEHLLCHRPSTKYLTWII